MINVISEKKYKIYKKKNLPLKKKASSPQTWKTELPKNNWAQYQI